MRTTPRFIQPTQIPHYLLHHLPTQCLSNHNTRPTCPHRKHCSCLGTPHGLFIRVQRYQMNQFFQVGESECCIAGHGYRMQYTPFSRRRLGRCANFEPVKFEHVNMIHHNRFFHRSKFQLLRSNSQFRQTWGRGGVTVPKFEPASPSPLEVSQNYTSHHSHVDQ
jgi:hypothetical protein